MYICKCTKCDARLMDENPRANSTVITKKPAKLVRMVRLTDAQGGFYGCPNCKTDDYLMDTDTVSWDN